ncbi:MAG: PAS domain S-box protein [Sulfuricella denitrificans]|nr:PAS domain S-box protein [Sulfuricella denitrificans]
MDVIYFVYGLAFISLALVILVQPREESQHDFTHFIWLLIAFGFTHGLLEWMDLWTVVRGGNPTLEMGKILFLFLSFGFLFEFGRRLILVTPVSALTRTLLGKPAYIAVAFGFLLEFMLIPDWKLATIIASRYFLGFSGSTLTGIGFLLCFHKNLEPQAILVKISWAKKYFILAAVAFLLYGVMGGLVVPAANAFPANIINQEGFIAAFQIPVQLFRAACAVLATIAIGNILRVFHEEARARLRASLALADERARELAESEASLRDIAATIGEGLYVMDRHGYITYTNPEAHHLLGWTGNELIHHEAHPLFHHKKANHEPHPSEACNIRNVVNTGRSYRSEEEVFWRKDGSPLNVRISASPIMRDGVIVGSVTAFSDITERKQADIALQTAKNYAENLINTANAIFVELDVEGNVKLFNQAAEEITGYTLEEVKGRNWFDLMTPRDRYPKVWEMFERLSAGGLLSHFENPILTKTGEERYIVWKNSEVLTDGQITGLITFGIDITERRQVEEALFEQKEYLNAILESEPECVKVISTEGKLMQMNAAGLAMLEVDTLEEAQQHNLTDFILSEYQEAFLRLSRRVFRGEAGTLEFPIRGKRGTQRWLDTHATPLRDREGGIIALVGVTRDITERKKTEEQIQHLAYFDTLTNLPNRRLLLDRLNYAVTHAKRHKRPMALMFLDLDRFKKINDTLGHDVGDELLKEVAHRLLACVRSGDTVSRQGGDEFVIVLPEITQPKDAALVAEKILKALEQPISIGENRLHITTSIGIATLPTDDSEDTRELMKKADMAMYAAKEAGRNKYRFCSCPPGYTGAKCCPESESSIQEFDRAAT